MPLASIYIDKRNREKEDSFERASIFLQGSLREIIAEALTCDNPDGALTENDIKVNFVEQNPVFDITGYDISIVIWANEYPERKENLDERTREIAADLKEILPLNLKCFVWVLPAPGNFAEFET